MAKKLNLNRTVYELTEEYPELIGILANLGFEEVNKTAVPHSVGMLTTIPRDAKMKGISMMEVVMALMAAGFELEGDMPTMNPAPTAEEKPAAPAHGAERVDQLKGYLRRLGEGETLENVRRDFIRDFGEADASEIMKAEQELIKEGTPLAEAQKLCDLHSALFHGATREERIASAEKAVEEALKKQASFPQRDYGDKNRRAAELAAIPGHPLWTLTRENEALEPLLRAAKEALAGGGDPAETLESIRQLSAHYAKKGDLLYPHLKVKYGVSGPSDVMWTVDDEIRDELSALSRAETRDEAWRERLDRALTRAGEMIYKEQNILFPICAVNFTPAEWRGVYRDSRDYDVCFGVEKTVWPEGERTISDAPARGEGEIVMPGGHMTLPQLTALLNTLPVEITFVDENNINRYFNEGTKVFKRPGMAIDREVFSCHPPKIEPMVRAIIDDFRAGRRSEVPVWMEKGGKAMLVRYMAVRDPEGSYLGTVEVVQDMEFAKSHFLGDGAKPL